MRRILVAVGCDKYEHLSELRGAESDASTVFDRLTTPKGDYEVTGSTLLVSPSVDEVMIALSKLPFGNHEIESLTFFFAGHGGDKSGTYYLCGRDTDPNRLSTTGLAMNRLLSVITELKPLQANVLIDACQSGSAMLDSAALLRADALGLGNPGSLSIAFLAACGPSEYASEMASGGFLTQAVLSFVRGDETLQTTRPALDLIDLGRRVSQKLTESVSDQVPVSWGINLTGEGRFARNPHFAPATEDLARVTSVTTSGDLSESARKALHSHAFALWSLHRDVEREVSVRSLRRTLMALITDLKDDKASVAKVLRGLATSLRASAVKSADTFAESIVLFTCAEPFLTQLDDPASAQTAQQLLDEAAQAQSDARRWLLKELQNDRFALLADGNGLADLYFLPLRLSQTLGWLAVAIEVERLSGRADPTTDREVAEVARLILEHYPLSLTPRSDTQAPFIFAFMEAARRRDWTTLAEQFIGCYFAGFLDVRGAIAKPDISDEDAFVFTLGLSQGAEQVEHRLRANPTQLLSVLLIFGSQLKMDDDWDPDLSELDHEAGYLFVPVEYADFGATDIALGSNFIFQIGRDVFTIADFSALVRAKIGPVVQTATKDLSPLASSLALVASCLQPDRVPLHLLDLSSLGASPN
jgi:hypothetical protein